MKIVTIVGARPQFIKAAPVSKVLRAAGHQEYLVHTGQHYDFGMSDVFFTELDIAPPSINLGVGSGQHAHQTGQMMMGIEDLLLEQRPELVLVYGDTNSTLAGALATIKLQIKLAHVEAGLRSYNRHMPEEHNRVLTDHCADLLFCPTKNAVENLAREGITEGVHLVGDTMFDALQYFGRMAEQKSQILTRLNLTPKEYLLATIHRASNTDYAENLISILAALEESSEKVVFPIHPRTRQALSAAKIKIPDNVIVLEPAGYLDMLNLERNARLILTDSGGIQKEAYLFQVPCLTLRDETEWIETTESGWNLLVGTRPDRILAGLHHQFPVPYQPLDVFGDGHAAEKIFAIITAISGEMS